jgi:hypothetical protein
MITYANKLSDEMVWNGHQSLFFKSVLQARPVSNSYLETGKRLQSTEEEGQ